MEEPSDDITGAIGGATGAVVGTVVASLAPFAPTYLVVASIIGGVTAYIGFHLVRLLSNRADELPE